MYECRSLLTHGSPGAVCVRAVAPRVQADTESSQRGPAPGEPSFASGPHTRSSLRVGGRGRNGAVNKRDGDRWEISGERSERKKQQDFRTYVM